MAQCEIMKYLLALDSGTTSSRALLISHGGQVHASAQKEFPQHYPHRGWVEHDPQDIWSSQLSCISEVMANVATKQIAAIGIANQRETVVVWERKTGQPVMRAIVWQDRRTVEMCQHLKKEGLEPLIHEKTGLLLDPYFSATKLHWILKTVPNGFERAKKGELAAGTIDTWLLWNLTGGKCHMTDVTNASRTLLFNIHTLDWDEELLSLFSIPREILPEVKDSSDHFGEFGSIPITGIAGDQQAALFGQACFSKGMVKVTYGTGCFLLMNTEKQIVRSKNNLISTIGYKVKDDIAYALEGSVFVGGAVVQWLRDNLGVIKSSSEIEDLAKTVPDCGGVYFVPAFTGLGAPHWSPNASGLLLGLTRGSSLGHIAKSALDSIAHQVMDVLKAMEADAGISIPEIRVDGGAVQNNLLMQFQSDIMNVPVIRPKNSELTAFGAAHLAGLAVGFWKNQEEIASHWHQEHRFLPNMPHEKVSKYRHHWKMALQCAHIWAQG